MPTSKTIQLYIHNISGNVIPLWVLSQFRHRFSSKRATHAATSWPGSRSRQAETVPLPGISNPGSSSQRGISTKALRCILGCGTASAGKHKILFSSNNRSRSIYLGPHRRLPRVRPRLCSTSIRVLSNCRGSMLTDNSATELVKSG